MSAADKMPDPAAGSTAKLPQHTLRPATSRARRYLFLALGWAFFALGAVGAVLPVLPTTPFMILALWAFSQSSERFHHWLYNHRVFGPRLQQWQIHRAIPRPVKLTAFSAMIASLTYVVLATSTPWPLIAIMTAVMLYGVIFIARCPSGPSPK